MARRGARPSQTEMAVLGALSVERMTAYAMREAIRDVLGHFWSESLGQIYPTLDALEAEGHVVRNPGSAVSRRQREPIRKVALADGSTRWRVVVDAGTGPDGKRRQVTTTHATQRAAREHLARTRTQVADGVYVARSQVTLGAYIDEWLAGRRHGLRAVTVQGYTSSLAYPRRVLGHRPLAALTRADVSSLVDELRAAGRSPRTAKLMVGLLQQVLSSAMREGLAARNVALLVDRVPQPHREMLAWAPDESRAFLAATGSPGRGHCRCAAFGARRCSG